MPAALVPYSVRSNGNGQVAGYEPMRSLSHPVYRRGRARVRPYPFDATVDGLGVMLGNKKKGSGPSLVARKPEDQGNVAPTDYGENASNPVFGRTATWRTFHLGMGLAVEDEDPTRAEGRYRWAINADCSVANRLAMQGPQILTVTPTTRDPNGTRRFFDLGGRLYWLNGRYLQRLDSDTSVTTVYDFGANHLATDVVVFASNGLGGAVWAYIAVMDYSTLPGAPPPNPPDFTENGLALPMYRFDGTTVTQHTTITASHFCVIGRNFFRANNRNQVSTVDVDTDPWVEGNWAAENQYLIGDKTAPISALVATATGTLLVFKWDGVYSVDEAGEQIAYYPFMKFGRAEDNGRTWGAFLNDLYVRYGESLYRIQPDMTIEEVGPNRYGTVDGPVKGRTTAFAGHGNFHAYTGLWNPDNDSAFLLKYGAHQPNEMGEPERIEAWHGSLSRPFENNRITALYVSGTGAPAQHNRMYVGLRDGTVGFFVLPCVPDPAACDQYRFDVTDGWVVMPNWHGGFPSSQKPLRYAAVSGDNLDGNNYATVSYRLDPVSADAVFGMPWIDLAGHFDTLPSERIDFPDSTQCKTAAFRLNLHCTDPAVSPLLSSFSIRWRLSTDFQQVYDLYVVAEDGLVTRDGTPLRYGAKRIRETVRRLAESGGVWELVLPDEEIKLVSIYDYGESIGWWERGRRWLSMLKIGVAEDATGSTYGTYGRLRALRYGDLRGMKYGDLRSL
jgi:hypothetical protein